MSRELDFEQLMDEAYDLPQGKAKLNLLEEAARLADANDMTEEAYHARGEIVETATFCGYPMHALIAFSWQLGKFDEQPEEYDEQELMWSYKWILGKIPIFSEVSRDKILELAEDFGRRYKSFGYSERSYLYYRFRIAVELGELEEAGQWLAAFQKADADYMSDCSACEQNEMVRYWILKGNDERAVETAKPIISGAMSCAEVPHLTLPVILMPLYRLGRQEEADKLKQKAYKLIRGKQDFIESIGSFIEYLTHTDPAQGINVLEESLAMAVNHEDPHAKLIYYAHAAPLLKRWFQQSPGYRLRLPAEFPYKGESGDLLGIADYFSDYAVATAQKYDIRNGNGYTSSRLPAIK